MDTPEEIREHAADYKSQAWKQYNLAELGQWVYLLAKRSRHRTMLEKKNKDIHDARNYLAMMKAHLDHLEVT
jgi:hypothetical protein